MVEDICFHLIDLVQNSVAAGARNIRLNIVESKDQDTLTMEVADDGHGMDKQTLEKVQDPFFTTKSFKKVGLGIPLLKATAQICRGDFDIRSEVGRGTEIKARMQRSHLDCPPLGNLEETLLSLLVSLDQINLHFLYHSERGEFSVSSDAIRQQVGEIHFSHPEIYHFLREYIHAGLGQILAPVECCSPAGQRVFKCHGDYATMTPMEQSKEIIIEILKNLDLFRELSFTAIKELTFLADERMFQQGETIFEESTTGKSLMVIISGEVRITQLARISGEETLTVLKKGDFFGEMALLEELPRSATAIAHSDTFILEISRDKFLHFIEKDTASGVKILLTLAKILSSRLREADVKIKAFVNLSQWI